MGRERQKKILVPNSVHTRHWQENSEKNSKKIHKIQKPLSGIIFLPQRDEIGREREKKILVPNSVHTLHEQENSEKNSKNIQKIKKRLSSIIFSQNGTRQDEKERKKFLSRIPFILNTGKKIPKEIAKTFKKLKNVFPVLFFAKTG